MTDVPQAALTQAAREIRRLEKALAAEQGAVTALRVALTAYGRHPAYCPKGVGVGHYTPPADAVCNCGIDVALAVSGGSPDA